jgi:hypothetical protein
VVAKLSRISMSKAKSRVKMKFTVREVFANGDERCELRWPLHGNMKLESHVKDWREVRGVNFDIDLTTSEAVLSFTRSSGNSGKLRRPGQS